MKFASVLITLLVYTVIMMMSSVESHSWIACTDYLENNGEAWDYNKCRAYPRHGHQFTTKTAFGVDRGYNIINPPDDKPCRTERDDNGAYTNEYPQAVYYKGQRVVIAHPTKNHVADTMCTNKYIPDNGNFIWRGPVNGQADVSLKEFQQNVVADLGVGPNGHETPDILTNTYPKAGFMNAPLFCQDTDKALATNVFEVPQDLQAGTYTLMWGWYFNSPMDLYTSCWEVDIVDTKAQRDAALIVLGLSTEDAQNVGDGDTPPPNTPPTAGPTNPTLGSTQSPDVGATDCPCKCDISLATGLQAGLLVLIAMVTVALAF